MTVLIKPLEWGPYPYPHFASDDVAVAPFETFGGHKYQVQRDPWGPGFMAFLSPSFGSLFWESKGHERIDAAKAAAQADFEARIRSTHDGAAEPSRPCTCHPDDNPPVPCQQKYALSDCLSSSLIRRAYALGFAASGEGYNAEYPFDADFEGDEKWVEGRDFALASLLSGPVPDPSDAMYRAQCEAAGVPADAEPRP